MVSITDEQVADALHIDYSDDNTAAEDVLPTGHGADIDQAETLIESKVEPYANDADAVEQTAVLVAAAFVSGGENDFPLSSINRNSASLGFDTSNMSEEAMDYWTRAKAMDPTDRLGQDTISFETF